ncbi:MAG: CDP-glucose 4,6-dehydratase, partial [Kiritimatiellia bacterium]
MFHHIYRGKTVLITGHAGFKGSWLAFWLTQMGAKVVG